MANDVIDLEGYGGQEPPASVLPKTRKKIAGGALTQDVQPAENSFLPMARRRLLEITNEQDRLENEPVDMSAFQDYARKQGQAGESSMLNALAAQFAGDSFEPIQAQFLKRAAAAQEPIKVTGGVLTPDGQFVKDPNVARDARRIALERQQTTLLGLISKAEQAQTTAEQRQAQAEINNQLRLMGLNIQQQGLAIRQANAGSNKPPVGYRYTPDGDLQAIPGGPADVKAQADAQRKADGSTDVEVALGTLRNAYDRLEKGGGITSTTNNALSNAGAAASSSALGQALGKTFGTSNQSARNEIAMARPALLGALMKATGMSAKQMDSNAELKLWLSTATDPTLDVQANRKALDDIERKYLRRGTLVQGGASAPDAPRRIRFDANGNVIP